MPNTIPGVTLPGDLEYKNTMLVVPDNITYTPHQSRLFWLDIMGRGFTGEDASRIAKQANGQMTSDYLDPEFLQRSGLKGLVLPSLEANFKDEKKTVYNWAEHAIDDNTESEGEFDAAVATLNAGTEYTFTVLSTTKLRVGRVIKHQTNGTQIRVSSVDSSTQFKGYVLQNTFTTGSSSFPGTDTAAAGTAVADGDKYTILAPAQKVGGTPITDEYSRPTQRRNALQTVAYEFEKTGHAEAERGTHATPTTELDAYKFMLQYRALCAIDDTIWHSKYARQVLGTEEVYTTDGIEGNIGTSNAITTFGSGTTLDIDKLDAIMVQVTKSNRPEDLVFLGNSELGKIINKLGRANTTIEVEPGTTDFGTSFLRVHTHRGTVRFFEMPESKTAGDTNNILRAVNTKYIMPVMRKGRGLKWENNVKKDGTQDAKYDVYRGDISVATFHKTAHEEITGITG